YLKGHGVRSVDANDPITGDTLFPIASCTKGFTTVALAILADEGKLSFDDPVRKHLPFFRLGDPLADREGTLPDLVCHRSGRGPHEMVWFRPPGGPRKPGRRAGRLPPNKPFRSTFQYQSTMFTAAGLTAAAVSGTSWDSFVQKRLLNPL